MQDDLHTLGCLTGFALMPDSSGYAAALASCRACMTPELPKYALGFRNPQALGALIVEDSISEDSVLRHSCCATA